MKLSAGIKRLIGLYFFNSCIERWLKAKGGNDKCPQCNAPAKKKDIRNIYTKAIKSIDTTERDRALADLEKEKDARQKAEEREARALLQYQLAKSECERITAQLRKQEQQVLNLQTQRQEITLSYFFQYDLHVGECILLIRARNCD